MSGNNDGQNHGSGNSEFEHPSFWFTTEDKLKTLFGSYYYGADIKSLKLKGNERVLDFGCGGGAACLYLIRILNKKGHILGVDTSAH